MVCACVREQDRESERERGGKGGVQRESEIGKSPSFTPNSENGNWGVELVIFIFNKYFMEFSRSLSMSEISFA